MTNLINNGFSVNSAAEEVSTNLSTTKETIRGIYYRMIEHPNRTHGNSVFSDEEENALTALLEARSLCRQPMSRMAFIDFATTVFNEGFYTVGLSRDSQRSGHHSYNGSSNEV
ncbi:hypothetical protein BCR33DRAFT_751832 [Rhizoclosmatium globosum]|uniref:Uncharacterized protein n=1 Tax=Rhizoclosmatium globosum TaxID=329046 RepID=A0A1Y1ZUD6_9FUNG|nr:hypothetical protein BCR33DRAFT_751832 [Rhizoclosmatium globosum]|eukprot:ORY13667.1 hypothetical protein BCR33DRAFT_751832 [Rhizoclosmatium globosum]